MLFKICGVLQEFWVGNEELVNIYDERLEDAGYVNLKLARTNNRGDGMRRIRFRWDLCFLFVIIAVTRHSVLLS